MQSQINELDWKMFRSKLPVWQEAYMLRLNIGYAALLAGSGKASDKFWELEKRINMDKHSVGVVARMSRSNMERNIISLLEDNVITLEDLDGFSKVLHDKMVFLIK